MRYIISNVANIIVACYICTVLATPVFAVNLPDFPSCLNPQGTVIANYPHGVHGIVGSSEIFTGSDKVYNVTETTVMQCFCSASGSGIQTNWLKATGLSADDIKSLELSGWLLIPSGTPWGLDADAYLVQNINYSCVNNIGGSVAGTSSSSNSNSSSSSSSSPSSGTGSSPNNIVGQVLGLAFTGDINNVYYLWLYGLIVLILGICLKKILARKQS